MTLTLLFARHGETHHNVLRQLSTAPPGPPLNATGRLQAEQLAERVTGPVDALYSSSMTRAVETARIVGTPRGLAVHVDDGLRELSAGELDGGTDDATFDRLGRDAPGAPLKGNVCPGRGLELAEQVLLVALGD